MADLESAVRSHYGVSDLAGTIVQALHASGLDPQKLKPADLAPIDEFHHREVARVLSPVPPSASTTS